MNPEELAQFIKERRKSLKVTQRDLAQLAEVSVHTIIDLETGKANPTLDILNKILDTLGLRIEITTGNLENRS